ncbi:MAG: hypothetical protein JWO31_607 [Phycisphaerales bacterium]|nr:hypothetical protein [Phycisphaerales bacterium]
MPPTMDSANAGAGLLDALRALRRRVKLLGAARGAGIVLAAAVGLVVAAVLLDYLLKLPPLPRAIVNLAALAALGYAAWAYVVRPAVARLSLSDLAGRIESTFPQFDDTLRSTVTFTERDVPGSAAMKQRTVERARQVAADVDLSRAVALRPVWGSTALGLGALVALLAVTALVDPALRRIAADRLFAGSMAWPKRVEIELLDAPAGRVAAGGELPLRIKLTKGTARTATVRYRFDNGPWQQEVLQADAVGAGTFTTKLKTQLDAGRDLSKLQIVVQAGDDERELAPIAVVPPLEVRQATATVTPPPYSKLPPAAVNLAERPAVAAAGAEVELTVAFNKALDAAKGVKLEPADGRAAPKVAWSFPRNGVVSGKFSLSDPTFKPEDSFRFVVRATDADGFTNGGTQEYQVTVHEDVKPTVVIELPRQSEERTPNATVPLRVAADDDYGFDALDLVVEGKSPNLAGRPAWVIPLVRAAGAEAGVNWQLTANSTVERKRFVAEYLWDLGKLSGVTLKPGDRLEFFARARDNFDLNGVRHDPVDSTRLTISIISHDQFEAWVEMQLGNARQEIGAIKKAVDVTKAGAEQQSKETRERAKLDDAQRTTINRLANQQATAAAQAKQTSQKLTDLVQRMAENKAPEQGAKQAASEVAKELDRAADAPMKDATNKLTESKETKADPKGSPDEQKRSAEQAAKSLDDAAKQQDAASKQLDAAMNKLSEFGGLAPSIQKIEAIKKEQDAVAKEYKEKLREALGKKPEDMTPQQKKDLKDLTDRQDNLSKETEKALKDLEAKADKMQKSDPQAAKAMKEAAQTGQQQGVPQKQSSPKEQTGAAQQMQQNQQANAQQKHKEIELGLDMMLDKLKAAEQAKLEELQKQLAELQQLLEALIARQAGHNIDNLMIQDPSGSKVAAFSEADRAALFEQAKREEPAKRDPAKPAEPKPELAALTPSQEQTHRNTADVAKKAEALPDATPAGKIAAAAANMEQAAVHLRQKDLPAAYSPKQVDALKNLVEAKKLVDAAKNKNDDQEKQKQEESIKQAYVALLERQTKVNAATADIDKNGKDEEGNLKRSAARDLAALPGEQGKLAEEATKLGEKLKALKSIVYVWANKDIVNTMGEVKEDLAKPRTDAVVQAQQARVAEQLKAMIDNLAKKPPEKKEFAERKEGGGGGGQGKPPPKMPTDVELRLLRDLQGAVNKATTVVDAEVKKAGGKKDEQKLLGLGGRQGELRNLLDQVIKGASEGKVALGPEPKDKEKLPEEAGADELDEQEFVKDLVQGKVDADQVEKTVKLVGDRMGRSRQRLALDNDPGKVTQEIQKRIVLDLDNLVKLAQQQQGGGQPKPGQGKPGDPQGQPKPGDKGQQNAKGDQGKQPGQQQQPAGQEAAQDSTLTQGGGKTEDLSKELKEKFAEWGLITQRDRGAVMEGKGEAAAEKYRKYVDDYYRELAKRASER